MLAVRRSWKLCVFVFAFTFTLGWFTATDRETSASATAVLAAAPNPSSGASVQNVSFIVPAMVELVSSPDFIGAALADTPEEVRSAAVDVSGSNDQGTGLIRIEATSSSGETAATWANEIAEQLAARYQAPTAPRTGLDGDPVDGLTSDDLISIEIVREARPSRVASPIGQVPIMLASGVLGLIAAALAAIVVQKSQGVFDVEAEIESQLGVPVLGTIPSVSELHTVDATLADQIESGPVALIDSFQTLRANVESRMADGNSVVAVTSWQSDEGKSTVSAGLSLMLASVGKRVVAIDANLRDPQLHVQLGEPFGGGMTVVAKEGYEVAIQATQRDGLFLVPAGLSDTHPAEVVSVALPRIIGPLALRDPGTWIVIDGPSLGLEGRRRRGTSRSAAETLTVVRNASSVLLVVSASSTRLPELAAAVRSMRTEGIEVVGAVINRQSRAARLRRLAGVR